MNFPDFSWVLFGTITGLFWGIFALFWYTPYPKLKGEKPWVIARSIYTVLFQFAFNFIGGFAGWFCIKIFLNRLSWGNFNFPELILLCIALLAISGRLSVIMYKLPEAIMQKVNKYFGFSDEKGSRGLGG
jgi:hypothetical protein